MICDMQPIDLGKNSIVRLPHFSLVILHSTKVDLKVFFKIFFFSLTMVGHRKIGLWITKFLIFSKTKQPNLSKKFIHASVSDS